jgi:polar amino acid transport system substrate-binding protein
MVLFAQQALSEVVTVFTDNVYAPISYMSPEGPKGVLVDIFKKVGDKNGETYKIVPVPWKRAITNSEAGLGGITCISWTSERDKKYLFSKPIFNDDVQLIVIKGKEFKFNSISDLRGKRIGGLAGASYGEEVDKAMAENGVKIDTDSDQIARLKRLAAGYIDIALIGNGDHGLKTILESDPELHKNSNLYIPIRPPLVKDKLYFAYIKTDPKAKSIIDTFNKGLSEINK